MPVLNCRHFNGYKPCGKNEICDELCPQKSVVRTRILLVHLEALGAVLRTTALLRAIKRKYPNSHITWVTQKPADILLQQNPFVDRILSTHPDDLLVLSALHFDVALCVDKSLKASGVLRLTRADMVFGFLADSYTGSIQPATAAAEELWQLGLSNQQKFFQNQKAETQLAHEALDLGPYLRDEYVLSFTPQEQAEVLRRRQNWASAQQVIVGLNTGCSAVIPYKKLSIEMHRNLLRHLSLDPSVRVVLLGGREDQERNQRIAYGLDVISSATDQGLRDGAISVAACDIVVTGDSLGMHMAIALQKWVVAWFGPTCEQEIDLYDRGVKVLSRASCSPCWKRVCDKNPMCYDLVALGDLVSGIEKGKAWRNAQKIAADSNSLLGGSASDDPTVETSTNASA